MTPSHARAESEIEPANAIDRATSPTIRRSNISAIAPAGVDTSGDRQHQRCLDQRHHAGRRRDLRHRPRGADPQN